MTDLAYRINEHDREIADIRRIQNESSQKHDVEMAEIRRLTAENSRMFAGLLPEVVKLVEGQIRLERSVQRTSDGLAELSAMMSNHEGRLRDMEKS